MTAWDNPADCNHPAQGEVNMQSLHRTHRRFDERSALVVLLVRGRLHEDRALTSINKSEIEDSYLQELPPPYCSLLLLCLSLYVCVVFNLYLLHPHPHFYYNQEVHLLRL